MDDGNLRKSARPLWTGGALCLVVIGLIIGGMRPPKARIGSAARLTGL
jgi:hypothetical protein